MLKFNKSSFMDRMKSKWSKFGAWKKLFVLLLILFLLFWISLASLIALPAISSVYFLTCIIKNVMDIHANWKWGSLFSCEKDSSCKIIGEVEDSYETFIKFPTQDPRTPKVQPKKPPLRSQPVSENARVFVARPDSQRTIRTATVNRAQGAKPASKVVNKKESIQPSQVKPFAGGEKAKIEEDKTVFDKSAIETDKIFDPSREDPSKIHSIKPEELVDDEKKENKKKSKS